MTFKSQPVYGDDVYRGYYHVDNGGFGITVDRFSNVKIDFGFHGYSNTEITLSTIDIDAIIGAFQDAKRALEEQATVERLRGVA